MNAGATTVPPSSLTIVPVAVTTEPSVQPTGLDRVSVNVSFASGVVSPRTGTTIVAVRWPARNVTVPWVAM